MKRLLALLFVLPIYLPIVNQCGSYFFYDPGPGPATVASKCPVVEEPQPCINVCDGVFCWPPCDVMPGVQGD